MNTEQHYLKCQERRIPKQFQDRTAVEQEGIVRLFPEAKEGDGAFYYENVTGKRIKYHNWVVNQSPPVLHIERVGYGFASNEYDCYLTVDGMMTNLNLDYDYKDPDEQDLICQVRRITGLEEVDVER